VLALVEAGDTPKLEAAFRGKAVLLGGIFRFEDRCRCPSRCSMGPQNAARRESSSMRRCCGIC
jgi:hypothetical protein